MVIESWWTKILVKPINESKIVLTLKIIVCVKNHGLCLKSGKKENIRWTSLTRCKERKVTVH